MEIYGVQDFKRMVELHNPDKWCVKRKDKGCIYYHPDVITFDTEFTTFQRDNPDKIDAFGLLYLWQADIFGYVVMGRDMKDFAELMGYISSKLRLNYKRRVVCYVHNLECDFMFLQGYFEKWTVFAPEPRAVLTAMTGGIEFRCSYKLTNMSLKKFLEAENVETQKADGKDFDYNKKRTPVTPLLPHEVYYAYCDVKGLYEAIHSLMEHEGDTPASIPLTSTGYVRRDCKKSMEKKYKNWLLFNSMKLNKEQYKMFKSAFRGGNTHANRHLAGYIVEDVQSFDIASSYPSVMLYEKYPMGPMIPGTRIKTIDALDDLKRNGYGYIINVEFLNLRTTDPVPYIPTAKSILHGFKEILTGDVRVDNGRILEAGGWTEMDVVDVDFDIIRSTYKWDDIRINKCYYYRMGPLPKEFKEVISDYFVKKTTLKGVEGQEYFYAKSKNKLNACYGMTVTDPVHKNIKLKDGKWSKGEVDEESKLKKFYNSRNNFLSYQWGVYITAYARARLQEAINICGEDIVYCDTDSVKFRRSQRITDQIMEINSRLEAKAGQCEVQATAYTMDGKKQTLGLWDEEHPYLTFLTYGAKKYADTIATSKGPKFEITVSGLSKSAATEIGDIYNFNIGLTIHNSGRTVSVYDDTVTPHFVEIDGQEFELRGNMAIVPTTYTLGMPELYMNLIQEREYSERMRINGKDFIIHSSNLFEVE